LAYREHSPAADLTQVVACTWEREVPRLDASPDVRVLPDGCVDLIWREGELLVAGPDRGHFLSPLRAGTHLTGVRLRPGMAGLVLALPAGELRDRRVGMEYVWGREGAELGDRLGSAAGPDERRGLLEEIVRSRLADAARPDELVAAATRVLGGPGVRVGELGFRLGLSERHLRRRFNEAVGYGPKTLDRVLRFQRLLTSAGAVRDGSEQLARLAAGLGYSDQAHLTRECRALSGLTPRQLIRSRSGVEPGPTEG
jgi:AraC-like DNA-binding protein